MSDQTHPNLPDPFVINPEVYGPSIFTRAEADGAWENGTQVRKVDEDADEGAQPNEVASPIGSIGTVIGSVPAEAPKKGEEGYHLLEPRFREAKVVYFVEWRHLPERAVGVIDKKLERV